MAKCAICEKGAHFGNNVSHSHRRSNKMWKSNVKSVKVKQRQMCIRDRQHLPRQHHHGHLPAGLRPEPDTDPGRSVVK